VIPAWLVQLGSMAGLLTFVFTLFDRLLAGRPLVSIRLSEYHREVFCRNLSRHDPEWDEVSRGFPYEITKASAAVRLIREALARTKPTIRTIRQFLQASSKV
jgi:hypothetical protein